MKVKQVELGYTYNLGNYESRKLSMVAELEEGDTIETVFTKIQETMDNQNESLRRRRGR